MGFHPFERKINLDVLNTEDGIFILELDEGDGGVDVIL